MAARFALLSMARRHVLELSLHHLVAGETQPRGKARPVAVYLAKHGAAALLRARDHAVDALDVVNPIRQGLRDDVLHGEAGLVEKTLNLLDTFTITPGPSGHNFADCRLRQEGRKHAGKSVGGRRFQQARL